MSHVITKRVQDLAPEAAAKGLQVGLPPLAAMFNSTGTAYAAERTVAGKVAEAPIENRFVLWFNGNGIPERYWIPAETGANYRTDAVSGSPGSLSQRHPRHHRARQLCRGHAGPGQRPPQFDERPDDMHAVHRARRGRAFH